MRFLAVFALFPAERSVLRWPKMLRCTLVTCALVPALDPDDRLVADELRRRGFAVSVESWSDAGVDWSRSDLCVVRSTWDYHRRNDAFIAWVDRVAARTMLQNAPRLLKWNADKKYLRVLARRNVPVVPTVWVRRGAACDLAAIAREQDWNALVFKPAVGAAGYGVSLVGRSREALAAGQARFERLARSVDVLVQPYLDAILDYGERALMFFDGRFSHAVVKKPFDRVMAVSAAPSSLVEATPEEISVGSAALAALPERPLYARVDLLRDGRGRALVSELELIEPALYFTVYRRALAAFADAVERRVCSVKEAAS